MHLLCRSVPANRLFYCLIRMLLFRPKISVLFSIPTQIWLAFEIEILLNELFSVTSNFRWFIKETVPDNKLDDLSDGFFYVFYMEIPLNLTHSSSTYIATILIVLTRPYRTPLTSCRIPGFKSLQTISFKQFKPLF